MKNVSHKNNWNQGAVQLHVEPPPIPLIKSKIDTQSDKYFVKIKLRRGPTSEKSGLYDLKMTFFDNGDLEEFLLFIWNFKMTLEVSETLSTGSNIQYLCTLVCGETLRQLDTLSIEVGSTTTEQRI